MYSPPGRMTREFPFLVQLLIAALVPRPDEHLNERPRADHTPLRPLGRKRVYAPVQALADPNAGSENQLAHQTLCRPVPALDIEEPGIDRRPRR